jgi:hypothetical protein
MWRNLTNSRLHSRICSTKRPAKAVFLSKTSAFVLASMRSRMPRILCALACLIASVSSNSSYSNSTSSGSSDTDSDGSFAPVYTSRVRPVSQGNVLLLSSDSDDSDVQILDVVPATTVRVAAARRAPASAPSRRAPSAPTPISLPAPTPLRAAALRTPAVQQRASMASASAARSASVQQRPSSSAHALANWLQQEVLDVGVYPSWNRSPDQCR